VTPEQIAVIRPRLVEFTAQMLGPLHGYHQPVPAEYCIRAGR